MKRRIAASLTVVMWGYIAYVGYSLTMGVIERMGPGYHDPVKWRDYFYFPLFMALANLALLLLAKRLPVGLFITAWGMQFAVLFVFILLYGGGV